MRLHAGNTFTCSGWELATGLQHALCDDVPTITHQRDSDGSKCADWGGSQGTQVVAAGAAVGAAGAAALMSDADAAAAAIPPAAGGGQQLEQSLGVAPPASLLPQGKIRAARRLPHRRVDSLDRLVYQ